MKLIDEIIDEIRLEKSRLVGQGLDGASNMSGSIGSLCTLVKLHLSSKASI